MINKNEIIVYVLLFISIVSFYFAIKTNEGIELKCDLWGKNNSYVHCIDKGICRCKPYSCDILEGKREYPECVKEINNDYSYNNNVISGFNINISEVKE